MAKLKKGDRVRLSDDAATLWLADYNVRVSSYATVLVTPAPYLHKVLVCIDSVDGEQNVTARVRKTRCLPI